MSKEKLFEELKKLLQENYDITQLELSTDFKKDLGLSSFDLLNLICLVEEKYGIEIDEEKYLSFETMQDICTYLETLVG